MAILDVFKKKEGGEKKNLKKENVSLNKVTDDSEKKKPGFPFFSKFIISSPHITEKATYLEKENKYIFRVSKDSNKIEIKNFIEKKYKVDVLSVKIIVVKRKKRRLGRHQGYKKGYKKAIVEIKKGQKIDLV